MMDRATRKYLMERAGLTQAEVARKLSVKPSSVCLVIKGTGESRRIKDYIAKRLKLRLEDLWPDDHERAA